MSRIIRPIIIQAFNQGGVADSKYSGIPNSMYRLIGWDIHSEPGILKANQRMKKISSVTLGDEYCKTYVDCSNGIRYWFSSESGKIWQEKSGVITLVYATIPETGSAICLDAGEYQGYIYWATQDRVHRIPVGNADGASNWTSYAQLDAGLFDLFYFANLTGASTYSIPTAISETSTNKFTITPTESPLKSIAINPTALGTGDWTITVHDSGNSVVASKTITNANMSAALMNTFGWYNFVFSTPAVLDLTKTYHVHVTVSTGTSSTAVQTSSDFSTASIAFFTTSDDTYHPFKEVNLVLYIGDKNLVHQIDNTSVSGTAYVQRAALDVKSGYRVSALGKMGTDLLVGTIIASNVNYCELFQWNTYGLSFTNSDIVYEAGINAFLEADNYVIVNAGTAMNLYSWNGQYAQFYKKIPGTYSPTQQARVNPRAVALFNGFLPLFGVSNITGDPCDEGIWSMGKYAAGYPTVLNLEFPTSNLDSVSLPITSGTEIGFLFSSGQDLFMSWRKSTTITVTINTPAVVTYTAHGLSNGDAIKFSTTGALPTGITSGTTYYIRSIDANSFNLYDTSAHAIAGGTTGRVNTSGTQSGVHTAITSGVDQLDYSNKILHPIAETRSIDPFLSGYTTFKQFIVTYEGTLPANTSILLKNGKNGQDPTDTDITLVDDTDRSRFVADGSRMDARTILLRLEGTTNGNNTPKLQQIIIDFEGVNVPV